MGAYMEVLTDSIDIEHTNHSYVHSRRPPAKGDCSHSVGLAMTNRNCSMSRCSPCFGTTTRQLVDCRQPVAMGMIRGVI